MTADGLVMQGAPLGPLTHCSLVTLYGDRDLRAPRHYLYQRLLNITGFDSPESNFT